ncbi:uncharacterized protein TOT_020000602 [Theileria orientalis strain Shintoku]|uniref:Trafficking protein particle complex subunit n=1 Tax=Theileria orientalis strain Shintoku TaxID=869250 RepID=J4C884_THEOR|nr:uncharacterized protein TOT_020000602 [Theileria orientalis strain Shintoku]BAM40343.1 uncharacterized protein TOT_020000602 [Theileria orientalis strain Shintoku]|eukprot:XP_009690644.1 uncharacterized protein TOT_020000602 [Theileria orientalis strain Shintoku]
MELVGAGEDSTSQLKWITILEKIPEIYYNSHYLSKRQRLHLMGFEVGCRILDALTIKDKITTRFTTIVPLLSFISTSVWKYLFNHHAVLMRGKDSYKEYMLNDKEFQITKYISMPRELQYSTCSSFIAGIVDGILSSAKFVPP